MQSDKREQTEGQKKRGNGKTERKILTRGGLVWGKQGLVIIQRSRSAPIPNILLVQIAMRDYRPNKASLNPLFTPVTSHANAHKMHP